MFGTDWSIYIALAAGIYNLVKPFGSVTGFGNKLIKIGKRIIVLTSSS